MKIFVSAAEISSDIHAEKIVSSLIQEFRRRFPLLSIETMGIGGPRLRAIPGFQCIEPAESLRAMGFAEVIGKLSHIKTVMNRAIEEIERFQPDLIMTFDYPDFHLRLMRRLKKQNVVPNALKVCGIPPKVWVWRSHRVERIRELYDGVWVIFPFEKKFYESKGIPVIYQGNPLAADLFVKEKHSISLPEGCVLAVMPGSREGELKYHLPVIRPALQLFSEKIHQRVQALVPVPVGVSFEKVRRELVSNDHVQYHFIENGTLDVLSSAPIGLIKSGTSTLEAALLGCVPVIFYKVNKLTEWIFRMVARYAGPVGLPNILLGIRDRSKNVFPELLGPEATPESLANALAELAQNPNELATKKERAIELKSQLVPSSEVGAAVACDLLGWIEQRPYQDAPRRSSIWIGIGSFVWSSVNWIRRSLYRAGIFHSVIPSTHSILVGNLQAGGSGKTPVVMAIAKEALSHGKKVAVISRGYGSQAEHSVRIVLPEESVTAAEVGDEPAELKKNLPDLILGVGSDRIEVLKRLPKLDLVIFDDGFQNLKFKAHQTVLCVTDRRRSEVLYRDFNSQKKEADLILNLQEMEWAVESLPTVPIWLVCGVGDPQAVARFYRQRGMVIRRLIAQPDHAQYDETEVRQWMIEAEEDGCRLAVTEKDFVKLSDKFPTLIVLKRELQSKDWIPPLF